MPFVEVRTNVAISDGVRDDLLRNLTHAVARVLGRPAAGVLASYVCTPLLLDGVSAPAALAELRCVPVLAAEAARTICSATAELLWTSLRVPPERLLFQVVEMPPRTAWRCVGGAAVSAEEQRAAERAPKLMESV